MFLFEGVLKQLLDLDFWNTYTIHATNDDEVVDSGFVVFYLPGRFSLGESKVGEEWKMLFSELVEHVFGPSFSSTARSPDVSWFCSRLKVI